MGEAKRKQALSATGRADKEIHDLDFSKIEQRLLDQGHKPDYLEPKKDDVLVAERYRKPDLEAFEKAARIVTAPYHVKMLDALLKDRFAHLGSHPANAGVVVITPAAHWRENGESDPHGGHYADKQRHEIQGGQYTDDEIAFQCGMADGRTLEDTAVLHRAKERIRWLSRQLVLAEKRISELEDTK